MNRETELLMLRGVQNSENDWGPSVLVARNAAYTTVRRRVEIARDWKELSCCSSDEHLVVAEGSGRERRGRRESRERKERGRKEEEKEEEKEGREDVWGWRDGCQRR